MIILVTGQPRHGKSQYSIKLLLDLIKENEKREKDGKLSRHIYCNIAGINEPNTKTKLPTVENQDEIFKGQKLWFGHHDECPNGYTNPPLGSVFIYDECHKVDWIREKSGTLSDNPTCISMNEHGHQDYIFILITQFPQYIHTHLRGLVEYHYHSKRFNGFKSSKIYKWNEFQLSPRTEKALKDAYEVEKFVFDRKYQNCYTSASAHDSIKLNIPKPFYFVFFGVLFLFLLFYWRYVNSPISAMVNGKQGATFAGVTPQNNAQNAQKSTNAHNDTQTHTPTQNNATSPQNGNGQGSLSELDKMGQELELLKLKAEIEQLKQNQALYAVMLEKNYQVIKADPNLQVRGVISNGKNCKAYNTNGDLMTLDKKECEWYLSEPGRVHKPQSQNDRAMTNYAPPSSVKVD